MNLPGGPKVVWAALRGITKSFTRYTEGEQLMPSHFLHLSIVVGLSANLPFQSEHEQFRISVFDVRFIHQVQTNEIVSSE